MVLTKIRLDAKIDIEFEIHKLYLTYWYHRFIYWGVEKKYALCGYMAIPHLKKNFLLLALLDSYLFENNKVKIW